MCQSARYLRMSSVFGRNVCCAKSVRLTHKRIAARLHLIDLDQIAIIPVALVMAQPSNKYNDPKK